MFLIGQSHLRFKSRVSESSLRIYQETGSKDEAASTDFAFLCFLKLDAYFPSRPCSPFPSGLIDEYVTPNSQNWMRRNKTGGLHALKY